MDGRPPGGDIVRCHRAQSFGRDTHGPVREEGDTRLASQISRINPSDQWGDRCRSQIALTSDNTTKCLSLPSTSAVQPRRQRFSLATMSGRVILHYFNGRGKMESIRWLLTVAEVEFDEIYLTTREQYEKLLSDGSLMFQQVPMVEIDGMKLIQTKAILKYIAEKYNLHGKDLKDRVMIDMYSEGLIDLMEMIMVLPFVQDQKPKLDNIQSKAKERYLPVFEKVLSGSVYLVGGKLSCADVQLLECTLMLEEKFPAILADFPNIKSFQGRMISIPAINRFLQPGSKRKPQPDETYVKTVKEVFNFTLPFP